MLMINTFTKILSTFEILHLYQNCEIYPLINISYRGNSLILVYQQYATRIFNSNIDCYYLPEYVYTTTIIIILQRKFFFKFMV